MNGPEFLLLYALLALAALGGLRWFNRRDPRAGQDLPKVPSPADPYELAWLRGGTPEATRLAVYDLLQSGHLEHSRGPGGTKLLAAPHAESAGLAPLARVVLRACAVPHTPAELMRGEPAERVDSACAHWRLGHEDAGLLVNAGQRSSAWLAVGVTMLALVIVTILRVDHAFAQGRSNVGFLIALTVVTLFALPWLARPPRRLTTRGLAYLERLRGALAPNRQAPRPSAPAAAPTSAPTGAAWSPMTSAALLPLALYGMDILPGAEHLQMQQLFPRAAQPGTGGADTGGASCGAVEYDHSSSGSAGDSIVGGDSGGGSGCGGCGGGGGGD